MALELEGFDSSLDIGERVTKFVHVFLSLLGLEYLTFSFDLSFSKSRVDFSPNLFSVARRIFFHRRRFDV